MTAARKATGVFGLLPFLCAACGTPPSAPSPEPFRLMVDAQCGDCQVEVGSELTLSALVLLSNGSAEQRQAIWTTENPTIATVDAGGRVRGISSGIATIRATIGSLAGTRGIRVVGRSIGTWKGAAVVRSCTATEQFDQSWCGDFLGAGKRMMVHLYLREDKGRVSGSLAMDNTGSALDIDGTLEPDGKLDLTARGEPWGGFLGELLAVVDPFTAQIRGTSLEGRFVMTIVYPPSSGFRGSLVVEADLDPASFGK